MSFKFKPDSAEDQAYFAQRALIDSEFQDMLSIVTFQHQPIAKPHSNDRTEFCYNERRYPDSLPQSDALRLRNRLQGDTDAIHRNVIKQKNPHHIKISSRHISTPER